MSLSPQEDRGIPTETGRVARAAFPKTTFCMRLRDVLGPLFTAEALLFESVLDRVKAADLLAAGGRTRTDSTHVLAAIRDLERLELVGETLRAALEAIAATDPAWLRSFAPKDWFTQYGARVDAYRLPKAETERLDLARRIGADGVTVLAQAWRADAPAFVKTLPAVSSLRAIWVQQYYRDDSGIVLRDK